MVVYIVIQQNTFEPDIVLGVFKQQEDALQMIAECEGNVVLNSQEVIE